MQRPIAWPPIGAWKVGMHAQRERLPTTWRYGCGRAGLTATGPRWIASRKRQPRFNGHGCGAGSWRLKIRRRNLALKIRPRNPGWEVVPESRATSEVAIHKASEGLLGQDEPEGAALHADRGDADRIRAYNRSLLIGLRGFDPQGCCLVLELKGLNLRKRLQEKILVTISLSRFDAVFQRTQSPCC
jgi:hypothetical protein